jgi:hypothetical protein
MMIIDEDNNILTLDYINVKGMLGNDKVTDYRCKATDLHIPSVVTHNGKNYFLQLGSGMFSASYYRNTGGLVEIPNVSLKGKIYIPNTIKPNKIG